MVMSAISRKGASLSTDRQVVWEAPPLLVCVEVMTLPSSQTRIEVVFAAATFENQCHE
jgi:hypothetical protein